MLESYATRYEGVVLERSNGVLEVRLHTDGGPLRWSHQNDFPGLFADIARDPDNRVVLITGTGDEFSGPPASLETFPDAPDAATWDTFMRRALRLPTTLLEIPVPVIGCLNGPAWRHVEVPLLSDVVLAAEHATIQDTAHFRNRTVPGDGLHVVMPLLLGANRGRYFLLTGQSIDAHHAQELGLVNEVLPADRLLDRAREIADDLAQQNPLVLRYTRQLLTHRLRRAIDELLGYGLALEGLAILDEHHQGARGGR